MTRHPPTLETKRLTLRPFRISDAERVRGLAGAKEVYETTLNVPHPYEEEMAEKWISTHATNFYNNQGVCFAIELKESKEVIGAVGLGATPAHKRAELGYWIGLPYWGQGYCTEAAKETIRYGFEGLHLHKIVARHMQKNPASGHVMVKSGMTKEGELIDEVFKDGSFHTLHLYGIIYDNHRHSQ